MIKAHSEMHAHTWTGLDFASKAAIKRALTESPAKITFTEIGTLANNFHATVWTVAELVREIGDSGRTLLVVGPDPYTNRRFYGTLSVSRGKVVVK